MKDGLHICTCMMARLPNEQYQVKKLSIFPQEFAHTF